MLLMKSLELFAQEHSTDHLMEHLNQYAEETNMDYKQFHRLSQAINEFQKRKLGIELSQQFGHNVFIHKLETSDDDFEDFEEEDLDDEEIEEEDDVEEDDEDIEEESDEQDHQLPLIV